MAVADLSQRSSASAKTLLIPPGAAKVVLRPASQSHVERVFELHTGAALPLGEVERSRIAAERLLGLGEEEFSHKTSGYRERALDAYQKSLEIWTRVGDRRREADVLCHIGRIDYQLADYKAQKEHYARALQLATAENDRAGEAAALSGMALAGEVTNELKNAETWANRALDIRRSLKDVPGQAETLTVIYGVQFIHGEYSQSRGNIQAAIALAEQSGYRLCEADVRNTLGTLESQLGNRDAAVAAYQRALEIDREEGDLVQAAQSLSNLGTEYGKSGDYREAVRALEEVLPIRKALAPLSSYGNTVYNLAVQRKNLGEYEQAMAGFREALAIFRQTNGTRGEGFTLREMGLLYLSIGEADQAEDFLRQAAAKWRSISDRHGEVVSLDALAELALDRGEVSKSLGLLTSALATARAAGLAREEEAALHLISRCNIAKGDARQAIEYADAARDVALKIPDRAGEADAAHQRGVAWRMLGSEAKAREALERALAIDQEIEQKASQVEDLKELARLEDDAGKVDQALALLETLGPDAARLESRMQFAARYRSLFDLGIDIRMRHRDTAGAFALSERGRARGLATLLQESAMDIREGVDTTLLGRERDLARAMDARQQRLAQLLSGQHTAAREAAARADLNRVVTQYHDIEAEIRRNNPRYSALVAPRTLSAAEVQKELLDPDTALIEYWLGSEHSYAWLVTQTIHRRVRAAGAGGHRECRATCLCGARRAQRGARANPCRSGRIVCRRRTRTFENLSGELSRILLGPIKGLGRWRSLWVVSDGALEYLPFAALPIPGTREPLVVTHEIERLTSGSIIAEMRDEIRARREAPLNVAIIADPVFRADDERLHNLVSRQAGDPPRAAADVDLFNLPRLYFSRSEADAITAVGNGKSREILGFDASRAEVMRQTLRDFRVVHFATHALLDSKTPELSGLVLSMVDRGGRPQDGFLRLHEIYNLRLNADLVVLSACRTALGAEVRSEGMIGLTRGFMYAGAPQVMASLWGIRDNATTSFMTQFYQELLLRHQRPASALRTAQLAMRNDPRWRQPYYWAAFTVQGAR